MNRDAQHLLWQHLNKLYVKKADESTFVLSIGKYLLYSDYSPVSLPQLAAYNTFELVDSCIACEVNYSLTGSRISTQWEQLLYHGKGPPADAAQKPVFENAKALLYTNYDKRERSDLYNNYIKASADFEAKKVSLTIECQQKYGDNWKTFYDQLLLATKEYQQFQPLDRDVPPLLQAIDEWVYGPLVTTMAPMKEIFEDNERTVVLLDGESKTYRYVSMIPSNWYQWFDPNQPADDDSWINISVDTALSPNDDNLSNIYKKLGGKPTTPSFVGFSGGADVRKKKVDIGDSQDVKIDLKVRSVQINRPWIDLSALKIQDWTIPGLKSGAWSTGVIDSSNNGSCPLLSTQMIIAKDITITGTKVSEELNHKLKTFNPSVDSAIVGGLFTVGANSSGSSKAGFKYDTKSNTIALDGTQVIGYVCTLLPKYPA